MPARRTLTLGDYEILDLIADGLTPTQIARQHGCSAEAVRWRIRQLKKNLPAPAARRADETLEHTLNAIAELNRNHAILAQLRDACLRLLEDENGRLDVGPHDYDLTILVSIAGGPPHRKPLSDILGQSAEDAALLSLEGKQADPRTLLLSTLTQIRQHIELAVRLAERIHDAQQFAIFQETMLRHIEHASPEVAAAIKSELHEQRQLRLALQPPPIPGKGSP